MWRYVLHSLYRCKTNGRINIRCTARTFLCGHGCVPAELTTRPADLVLKNGNVVTGSGDGGAHCSCNAGRRLMAMRTWAGTTRTCRGALDARHPGGLVGCS